MNMIWHDNPFIQFYMGKMIRYGQPTGSSNFSLYSEPHHIMVNGPKQTKTIMRTDGQKIKSRQRIIVLLQTDAAPMMILHFCSPFV